MKLVGNSYHDSFHLGVGEHGIVVRKGMARFEPGTHALDEIFRLVANGKKLRVACFEASLQVPGLRNRAATENSYPQQPLLFVNEPNEYYRSKVNESIGKSPIAE